MPTDAMAIEIEGLTKSFGRVKALQGLDLTVPSGQVTGFLGPNGSGKTTTLRILLGLITCRRRQRNRAGRRSRGPTRYGSTARSRTCPAT